MPFLFSSDLVSECTLILFSNKISTFVLGWKWDASAYIVNTRAIQMLHILIVFFLLVLDVGLFNWQSYRLIIILSKEEFYSLS